MIQAYALQLNIALWSGNNRKMEIAESHAQPVVTVNYSEMPILSSRC